MSNVCSLSQTRVNIQKYVKPPPSTGTKTIKESTLSFPILKIEEILQCQLLAQLVLGEDVSPCSYSSDMGDGMSESGVRRLVSNTKKLP